MVRLIGLGNTVNRMPRNRLPRVMKHCSPTGRRNHGRPLKRLLDTWDLNRSTSGPTPWQIYDDDELWGTHIHTYTYVIWVYIYVPLETCHINYLEGFIHQTLLGLKPRGPIAITFHW